MGICLSLRCLLKFIISLLSKKGSFEHCTWSLGIVVFTSKCKHNNYQIYFHLNNFGEKKKAVLLLSYYTYVVVLGPIKLLIRVSFTHLGSFNSLWSTVSILMERIFLFHSPLSQWMEHFQSAGLMWVLLIHSKCIYCIKEPRYFFFMKCHVLYIQSNILTKIKQVNYLFFKIGKAINLYCKLFASFAI